MNTIIDKNGRVCLATWKYTEGKTTKPQKKYQIEPGSIMSREQTADKTS